MYMCIYVNMCVHTLVSKAIPPEICNPRGLTMPFFLLLNLSAELSNINFGSCLVLWWWRLGSG